jgi:hypothetical protein
LCQNNRLFCRHFFEHFVSFWENVLKIVTLTPDTSWKWSRRRRGCGLWDSWRLLASSPLTSGKSRGIALSSTGCLTNLLNNVT